MMKYICIGTIGLILALYGVGIFFVDKYTPPHSWFDSTRLP